MTPAASRRLDPARLPRLRAAAQLLHRPVSAMDPVEIARAIAGAQAQDRHAGPLTFRSRSRWLTAADVDRARSEDRSLLRTWVMRKTIHLIPSDDAGWMLPLFEPETERWSRRRLEQLGMTAATQRRAQRGIARGLERNGPLTRSEVVERLDREGIVLNAQTRLHVLLVAVASGLACLGPNRGASTCLVLRRDWLGEPPRFDRNRSLAELARRYLRAFGPASDRDFSYWSGLPLRDVRAGLAAISGELTERRFGDEKLLAIKGSRPRPPVTGQIRLLGAFDTYLLGYRSRDFALPPAGTAAVKEGGGGWIRPVIVADGRVIGTWRGSRRAEKLEVELMPFGRLTSERRAAIEREVTDVGRFEGRRATLVDA